MSCDSKSSHADLQRRLEAQLRGVGSRFPDILFPIGIRELFLLRLFAGSERVPVVNFGDRTLVTKVDAVSVFQDWVKAGVLTFESNKENESPDARVAKCWNGFVGQMHRHSAGLGNLFQQFQPAPGNPKYYSIGLPPGAVEDQLGDLQQLFRIVATQTRRRRPPRP